MKNSRLLHCVLSVVLSLSFGFVTQAQVTDFLAYYPLNGNGDDISVNALNLTVSGTPATIEDRNGNSNSAYMFNGSTDFFSLRSSTFAVDAYTYSLWVKPVSQQSAGSIVAIGGSGGDQVISYGSNGASSGSYTKYKQDASNVNAGGTNLDGEWHHIAVVRDSLVHALYVDGELVAENTPNFPTIEYGDNNDIFIGKSHRNTDYFEGGIDEVKIFDRALSAEEIKSLCPQVLPCQYKEDNLVARYLFNNDTQDSWLNDYHGIVYGNPTFTEDRYGNENAALLFDGSGDYVDATNGTAFHLDQSYTYSAWIKPVSQQSTGAVVAGGGSGGDQVISYGSNGSNSGSYTKYKQDASNVNAGGTNLDSEWHHIVVVRDSLVHALYVDGELVAENTPNFPTIEYNVVKLTKNPVAEIPDRGQERRFDRFTWLNQYYFSSIN